MRFWLVVAFLLSLVFYSSEISFFLTDFFSHPFRHVVSVLIGMVVFMGCSSKSNSFVSKVSFYVFVLSVFGFLVIWAAAYFFDKANIDELKFFLGFGFSGFLGLLLLDRILSPLSEKLRKSFTQKAGTQREAKTDIRDIQNSFKPVLKYNPQKYFHPEKWFFGLDKEDKPIYFNEKELPHMQIIGASGSGKSALLGIKASETAYKGESTIVFDPKQGGDQWLASVLYDAAKKYNRPYYFFNILSKKRQINILKGATEDQIINLFVTGFMLEEKGGDSDYYKGISQEMAAFLAENYEEGMTIRDLSEKYDSYIRDHKADSFARNLRNLAEIEAINATSGISLKEAMDQGYIFYISGDWQGPKNIMAQRMLLARVIQIASDRDNTLETPKKVCVILDELSFQISKIFGDGLKIVRDKGVHFILAHQSIEDLKNVPENMNSDAFYRTVIANCPLKFVYRAVDNETAQYFSTFTGNILIDDETRNIEQTLSLTDQVLPEKQIKQTERNLVDFNTMLSLPPSTGVLFGNGPAQISRICPIEVEKTAEAKRVKGFEQSIDDEELNESSPVVFKTLG